jgi:ubiquinone/menaquinone biosynthesis C-methylase UbiE
MEKNHQTENQQPDPQLLAAQLRKPEGEFGIKVAEMLNNTNQFITAFTYDCVNPASGEVILEIGFGNGKLMPQLLQKSSDIKLFGIDFSEEMVMQGKKNLKSWIEKEEIQLVTASVENMPFDDNYFDKIATINTLYFWPNPLNDAKEVLRVLKPGGKICIGIRPKEEAKKVPATKYGFQLYDQEEAIGLFQKAGFENVRIMSHQDPPFEFNGKMLTMESWVIVGNKKSDSF